MKFNETLQRRWRRQRRRRNVGRAYDMALEVARLAPRNARILDVGCGSGYIAHHLSALLRATVVGLDLDAQTDAAIDYLRYDGRHFPVQNASFDVVLLCYVLHHAQDARLVLNEVSRVLAAGGQVMIYEDIPNSFWDRVVCWSHNRRWQHRTGPCSFRLENSWRTVFSAAAFEVISERPLSRWRNLAHPVSRRFYVLAPDPSAAVHLSRQQTAAVEVATELCVPA